MSSWKNPCWMLSRRRISKKYIMSSISPYYDELISYERECPNFSQCGNSISYGKKCHYDRAVEKNTKCIKCRCTNFWTSETAPFRGKPSPTRLKPFEWVYKKFLRSVKFKNKGAGKINILTYQDFISYTKIAQCHYCANAVKWYEYSWTPDNGIKHKTCGYQLDRKDNNKGYSLENCVVCCKDCNTIKSNKLSYAQMKKVGLIIQGLL